MEVGGYFAGPRRRPEDVFLTERHVGTLPVQETLRSCLWGKEVASHLTASTRKDSSFTSRISWRPPLTLFTKKVSKIGSPTRSLGRSIFTEGSPFTSDSFTRVNMTSSTPFFHLVHFFSFQEGSDELSLGTMAHLATVVRSSREEYGSSKGQLPRSRKSFLSPERSSNASMLIRRFDLSPMTSEISATPEISGGQVIPAFPLRSIKRDHLSYASRIDSDGNLGNYSY